MSDVTTTISGYFTTHKWGCGCDVVIDECPDRTPPKRHFCPLHAGRRRVALGKHVHAKVLNGSVTDA